MLKHLEANLLKGIMIRPSAITFMKLMNISKMLELKQIKLYI